jgi:hypothetical protein
MRHFGTAMSRFLRRMPILGPFVAAESALVAVFHSIPDYRPAALFAATMTAVAFTLYTYLISLAERRVGAAVDLMIRWNLHDFWQTRMIARKVLRRDVPIETVKMRDNTKTLSDEPAGLRYALISQCAFFETVALSIAHGRADEDALFDYFKRTILFSYPALEE